MNATCERCGQVMGRGVGCLPDPTVLRWGENLEYHSGQIITWNCHDCGTAPGKWHHEGCILRYDRVTGEQV